MSNFDTALLPLTIALPALCGLVILFAGRYPTLVRGLSLLGFALPAVVALRFWWVFDPSLPGGYDFVSNTDLGLGFLGISLHLGLNGISLAMFILAAVVGFAAGLYALQSNAERIHQYLFLLLFMQAGLLGVFASIDIFFFYFFHEFALIPTFLMIGIWGGRDRLYAAMKMTIYLTVGAMLSLAGLIFIYVHSGASTFDLMALQAALSETPLSEHWQVYSFGFLLFGFGILVSLWPFHTWAPLGYGAAPSSAAMLHAGVLKKFGLYGFIQIAVPLLPAGLLAWSSTLAWLALGNVIIIGLVTVAQKDLKQMIGYGSVMHMGYCFLGIACFSVLGAGGAVLLMVAHGLTVALLFQLATCIHHRTHTFQMDEIGGLVRKTPVLAAFFLTAILASIGLPGPGLANFWGELTIFLAVFAHKAWLVVPAALGVVISAVYGLRAVANIFYGTPTERFAKAMEERPMSDMSWAERLPATILLVVLLFIGVWPRSVSDRINETLLFNYPEPAAQILADSKDPS